MPNKITNNKEIKTVVTEIMNGREAAQFLKIGKSTLYSLVKRGEVPCFYIGTRMRFRRDELDSQFRSEAANKDELGLKISM
jgi:excisionase family DNA binding protein